MVDLYSAFLMLSVVLVITIVVAVLEHLIYYKANVIDNTNKVFIKVPITHLIRTILCFCHVWFL